MSTQSGPIYDSTAYAGFWRRTLALLLDIVLLYLLWFAWAIVWAALSPSEGLAISTVARIQMTWVLASAAYLIGLRMTDRGTLGYRIMRIQYAYALDGRPTRLDRTFRAVLAFVLLCGFLLDHIWIIFDERKQAWHDKISGFYVIKRGAKPVGSTQVVRRMIDFMMLSFPVYEPIGRLDAQDDGHHNPNQR